MPVPARALGRPVMSELCLSWLPNKRPAPSEGKRADLKLCERFGSKVAGKM